MNISAEEKKILQQQIALEYLIKMYQTLSIQITYKIIKLRYILLEVKALQYDLEFLNIKDGKLFKLINDCIEIRDQWFDKQYDKKFLSNCIFKFHYELENFLKRKFLIEDTKIYFEAAKKYHSSRNISYVNKKDFGFIHSGIVLPGIFAEVFGKRYFNFNSRFNKFIFFLEISELDKEILKSKFDFEKKCNKYNSEKFSFFNVLKSSIKLMPRKE